MFQKIKITLIISIFYLIYTICFLNQSNFNYMNFAYAKKINCCSNFDSQINKLNKISDTHSQCLIQLQQQLSENQQDIDLLRGQIQEIQHHISEVINNQKESYKKLNDLYTNLHKHTDITSNIITPMNTLNTTNNIKNDKILINKNVDFDYKSAVELVLEKKKYDQAIQSFQNFIKNYPKSDYQPNAHYWLGQLYYNQGNKNSAAYHFALVVKNYPKSSKASDALLKIGMIMQETDQKDKAKTIYRQIEQLYPNSDASKHAQKRLMNL